MTKACCIPACQALPLPRLFLRGQGNCLSSLSQRHFDLFICRAPATRDSNFGDYTPNFPLELLSTQGRGSRGDRSQRGGLGGRVFREGARGL